MGEGIYANHPPLPPTKLLFTDPKEGGLSVSLAPAHSRHPPPGGDLPLKRRLSPIPQEGLKDKMEKSRNSLVLSVGGWVYV